MPANLHSLAAQPNITTREHFPVEDDGYVRMPQTPGLGVTLNEETIERYHFVQN